MNDNKKEVQKILDRAIESLKAVEGCDGCVLVAHLDGPGSFAQIHSADGTNALTYLLASLAIILEEYADAGEFGPIWAERFEKIAAMIRARVQ